MPQRYPLAGSLQPRTALPPCLLSRAIESFDHDESWQGSGIDHTRGFAIFLAVLLDLCRSIFNQYWDGETKLFQQDVSQFVIEAYGRVELSLTFAAGKLKCICLSPLSVGPARRSCQVIEWSTARDQAVDCCRTRHLTSRVSPPVVSALVSLLWNCPYCPSLNAPFEHKWRTRIIDAVCKKEDDAGCSVLEAELVKRKERVLGLRGWCGGTVLHPASRLGNTRQLGILLTAIGDLSAGRRSTLLNVRNRDGYTPLMISRFYGQTGAAELLSAAGGTADPLDYFGNEVGG